MRCTGVRERWRPSPNRLRQMNKNLYAFCVAAHNVIVTMVATAAWLRQRIRQRLPQRRHHSIWINYMHRVRIFNHRRAKFSSENRSAKLHRVSCEFAAILHMWTVPACWRTDVHTIWIWFNISHGRIGPSTARHELTCSGIKSSVHLLPMVALHFAMSFCGWCWWKSKNYVCHRLDWAEKQTMG